MQIDVSGGGWLSVAQATERLGISKHAVRRRFQRGELAARQVRTRYGLAWQVRLDDDREAHATVAQSSREDDATVTLPSRDSDATLAEDPDLGGLVVPVHELQAKGEAAAMWQERAEVLAEWLAGRTHA